MYNIYKTPIRQLVADAWALRSDIDLTGVAYGQIHWDNFRDVETRPFNYYYFLAGLTRLMGARRVVEVGTHQGGSALAIERGFVDRARSKLVTFDVTPDGARRFAGHPVIRAHTLDANSREGISCCIHELGGMECDMTFIDATHDFPTTLQSWLIYSSLIRCPLVVLDDITLNESMKELWKLLASRYGPENAIDASEVIPEIRPVDRNTRPGFGVIRLPGEPA